MFRFTIRDMLWLTVVVAMGVAWWIDRKTDRALLMQSHADLQELRQMVGDKALDGLITMAKASNQAPARPNAPNTLIINLPKSSKPATGVSPPPKGKKSKLN